MSSHNNKRKRFRLLNLDFISDALPLLLESCVLLFETIGQRSDVMKSKMAARGKFKTRNRFCSLLLLNVTFPLSSKICNLGFICSNITSTRANSRGSLKGDYTYSVTNSIGLPNVFLPITRRVQDKRIGVRSFRTNHI